MPAIRTQGVLLQANLPNSHKRRSMPAPQIVLTLIENFERNLDAYRNGKYNETQVRRYFIDPLFKALGWDMDNSAGYAEAYRDVIHEDAIKVGISTRAPDYSFRVGGQRKLFLEAKKPSVNVKDDVEPAFQLRRYAWSAKLPLSIVTDFEEFAIYDCRQKPDKNDKASKARLFYCTFRDYATKWDEIAAIFSKDAVLKGSFDKYAVSTKGKRGTTEVDSAFLEEIESWRNLLAHNIALRNANLSQHELNFAVQQTIDRIIFLRICEDRGIETYGRLMALQNGVNVYGRLRELFRAADDRYNSGLFHFTQEKHRAGAPDELTLHLNIDDKPLKEIFKNLYYPDCPYEFSVLGADILGSVYEQFLGKVIRLTAGNRAVVEDKPEVKKAGGVFYTPAYIVQYIVQHTVGKLLEGKTSKQAEGIRILDPACGSGSFLIGAYQYLLDWYLARYVEEGAEKHSKGKTARIYSAVHGEWRLTTAERKRILLEHIYGVDIDTQAVEVTKLSLLLKVLEGESGESLNSQMKLFHDRVLPDLDRNIQCGNSLIGPDFYDGQLDLDDETAQRINAFDWQAAFPQIFKAGGFDAVIGNPPYIYTRNQGIKESQKRYFYSHYNYQSVQLNTFGVFLERCYKLLRTKGTLGFITPNNWLTIDTFSRLRQFILESTSHLELVNILDRVFQTANVDTAIISFTKDKPSGIKVAEMVNGSIDFQRQITLSDISPPNFIIQISRFKDSKNQSLIQKIEHQSEPLSKFSTVSTGLKAYQTGKGKPPQSDIQKNGRVFHATRRVDSSYAKYLDGSDVCRYQLKWSGEFLSYGDWLAEPRKSVPFDGERLLVRQIPNKQPYLVHAVFTEERCFNDINSMVVFAPTTDISLKFLLGIINSRLVSFWFSQTLDKLQRKIFPQFKVKELATFPIRKVSFSEKSDKVAHDKLVALVEKMLALHQQLAAAKTPQDTNLLQRQIDATDKQIDQLVYALTDEEIALVKGAP
jgi:type I restriction-modification system DNA methylase subunit